MTSTACLLQTPSIFCAGYVITLTTDNYDNTCYVSILAFVGMHVKYGS